VPVLFDEERRVWALQGSGVTYGLGIDGRGLVRHLYFGSSLPRIGELPNAGAKGIYPLLEDMPGSGAERFHFPFEPLEGPAPRHEYPAWGGMYYHEPCLKGTFSDGVRDTRLVYEDHDVRTDALVPELVVALRDPHYPLRVRLHYRLFEDLDLVERWAVVENVGEAPIILEQALSAVWHLPRGHGYRLTHLAGKWIGETQVQRAEITPGKKILESRRGNTSHNANPFFAVDRGTATEEEGEVWFGALGWSGNWKIAVDHDVHGLLQVSGGINDFDFSWFLEGGETFETPSFVGGYTREGFGQASRNLHRYAREYVLPAGPSELRPVLYNSWEATYFDVSEEGQGRLAEEAARIGVELFVVDDGWFGARNDDTAGLGDWWVNPAKFPNGLGPLIEKVHSLGMRFGLWVEPEMVNPDSDLYREHPDWVYHFPTRPRTESRNQLVLNLAREEVREYIFTSLDRLLSENDISFIKWDMNRPFSEPGWPEAPTQRQREIWVRHVRGLYDVLARLREKHPGVAFESCSGGGGRVDLGIMRYTDQVWTSDNTDPFDRLEIQEGYSMAYPARAMMCWVADAGKWVKNREAPLSYRFHSAMMGSLGVGGNLLEWTDEDLEEARELVERYKEIRDVVQEGNQYRLLSPREGDTTAVQYVSEDRSRSVIFVLRNPHRFWNPVPTVYPRGLGEETMYRVSGTKELRSGRSLMSRGMGIPLEGDLSSMLIELTETH
jgi:alpha-galactosidase